MVITMTRFNRLELEEAIAEKIKAGWKCLGEGIINVGEDQKQWKMPDNQHYLFGGSVYCQKFAVRMFREDPV